jgi:hypothetical protein
MDWNAWHAQYDQADSWLPRRLEAVRTQIRAALADAPAGPLTVVSLCAGDGRDILAVLADHPRRHEVRARLVELDPRNAAAASEAARLAGLDQVEVITGDAALTDQYRGLVPADLVLVCGVFGNITDDDIRRTVGACSRLCATGGTVIWTRHRADPDLVPTICEWFADQGFELRWLSEPEAGYGVGAHRFTGASQPFQPGARLFEFVGYDVLRGGPARSASPGTQSPEDRR